jgi:hypothetical protein
VISCLINFIVHSSYLEKRLPLLDKSIYYKYPWRGGLSKFFSSVVGDPFFSVSFSSVVGALSSLCLSPLWWGPFPLYVFLLCGGGPFFSEAFSSVVGSPFFYVSFSSVVGALSSMCLSPLSWGPFLLCVFLLCRGGPFFCVFLLCGGEPYLLCIFLLCGGAFFLLCAFLLWWETFLLCFFLRCGGGPFFSVSFSSMVLTLPVLLFQVRHTRSPSDNSLNLNTSDQQLNSKKFSLERGDSLGDTQEGRPQQPDSEGELTVQGRSQQSRTEGEFIQPQHPDTEGEITMQGRPQRPDNAGKDIAQGRPLQRPNNPVVLGLSGRSQRLNCDSQSGPGRPVGLTSSCPAHPLSNGGGGRQGEDGRLRRTSDGGENSCGLVAAGGGAGPHRKISAGNATPWTEPKEGCFDAFKDG